MGIFDQITQYTQSTIGSMFSDAKKAEKNIANTPDPMYAQYDPIGEIYDPLNRKETIIIDHNIPFVEESSVDWTTTKPRGALGSIYTYNMTNERTFPLHFVITDYDGTGAVINSAKDLLRKWKAPKVAKNRIIAPPPVIEFYYKGFVEPDRAVRCVLSSYSVQGSEEDGWNISTEHPYTVEISMTLAEIGVIPRSK